MIHYVLVIVLPSELKVIFHVVNLTEKFPICNAAEISNLIFAIFCLFLEKWQTLPQKCLAAKPTWNPRGQNIVY